MKLRFALFAFTGVLLLSCSTVQNVLFPPTPTPTPTATPTATATPTVTPTPKPTVAGNWTLKFDWDTTGTYSTGHWQLHDDGTFYDPDNQGTGTWDLTGDQFTLDYDSTPFTEYQGTLDSGNSHMHGTMSNDNDMSGTWYADKH